MIIAHDPSARAFCRHLLASSPHEDRFADQKVADVEFGDLRNSRNRPTLSKVRPWPACGSIPFLRRRALAASAMPAQLICPRLAVEMA
jgi:hypothetical protein